MTRPGLGGSVRPGLGGMAMAYLPLSGGTLTGPVVGPAGSAAAPSFRVGTEANGLYRYDATTLGFAAGGANAGRITSASALYVDYVNLASFGSVTGGGYSKLGWSGAGKFKLSDAGVSNGVVLNCATSGYLQVRNLADNDMGWVVAGAYYLNSTSGPRLLTHTASPEGAITAPIGSLCVNLSGGAGTTLYVKESGTGSAGWVGK